MKRKNLLTRSGAMLALFVATAAHENVACAQSVPAAASGPAASDNAPVVLSPFEVASDRDTGYRATSTLAGTRLRSDLKDVAASISVVTKDFMDDIAANDLENLLPYTLGTEVAGLGGNFSDATAIGTEGLTFNATVNPLGPGTRVRGLTAADSTRDFFGSSIPVDGYNVERTEISRGPNSMLFGLGSPSGIINTSLIRASLREGRRTKAKHQMASYGTARYEIDHDETLIKDKLGVRVASMYDKTYYRIQPAYVEKKALYLTSTYRLFRNTTIRLSGELGALESNRPQFRPPYDSTSHWWDVGRPSYNPATNVFTMLDTGGALDPRVTPSGAISLTRPVMGWAGTGISACSIPIRTAPSLVFPALASRA